MSALQKRMNIHFKSHQTFETVSVLLLLVVCCNLLGSSPLIIFKEYSKLPGKQYSRNGRRWLIKAFVSRLKKKKKKKNVSSHKQHT